MMVEYIVICAVALFASGLTFFSGFGLGTLLLPAFALFFPLPAAIAMTAVVHLLNNIFKLILVGQHADKNTVIRFGVPAILASFAGAFLLVKLSGLQPLWQFSLAGRWCEVTPVKLVIALLMVVFAVLELGPAARKIVFEKKYLPLGGLLSGFFGGLSGHQGALRSAFLLKCGLSKTTFIASGVAIACFVDVVRLGVYSARYDFAALGDRQYYLVAAVVAAFVGAFIGRRFLEKISMTVVRVIVAVMLLLIAAGLGSGLI